MLTLIDITVRRTIRHRGSEPIASEAATALVIRDEATGAAWPSKPAARDDRIMAGKSFGTRANHPRQPLFTGIAGNIWAARTQKWRNNGSTCGYARCLPSSGIGGDARGNGNFEIGTPVHGDEAGHPLDPPPPRP